jgi:hypothetical protein
VSLLLHLDSNSNTPCKSLHSFSFPLISRESWSLRILPARSRQKRKVAWYFKSLTGSHCLLTLCCLFSRPSSLPSET